MILYQYKCMKCDTLNHIHWEVEEERQTPFCCECGRDNVENYIFIQTLEVKEND
jgi:hypothetical protein